MKGKTKLENKTLIWIEPEDREAQLIIDNNKKVFDEANQWAFYNLNIAYSAFIRYLKSRGNEGEEIKLLNPSLESYLLLASLDNACQFQVGEFKVCLVVQDNIDEQVVRLSRFWVDIPQFVSHFYISLEICEESEQVFFRGILRYDQLSQLKEETRLTVTSDWNYEIPLNEFDENCNHFFFYLGLLNPQAIPLPNPIQKTCKIPFQTQQKLENLLATEELYLDQLWKYFTWEEGRDILLNNELLDWLRQWESQPQARPSYFSPIQEILQIKSQQVLNLPVFLTQKLNHLVNQLNWSFPIPVYASGWRSIDSFSSAIATVKKGGIDIPLEAIGSCRTFKLAQIDLEILAIIWVPSSESAEEWSLLIILKRESGGLLPKGLRIRIRDQNQQLNDDSLETNEQYWVQPLIGQLEEKFFISVEFAGEKFSFQF